MSFVTDQEDSPNGGFKNKKLKSYKEIIEKLPLNKSQKDFFITHEDVRISVIQSHTAAENAMSELIITLEIILLVITISLYQQIKP